MIKKKMLPECTTKYLTASKGFTVKNNVDAQSIFMRR